jgi:nuclear migration protein JNM1
MRRLKAELAEVEKEMSAGPSTQPSTLTPPVDSLERAGKRKSVLPPKEPVDLFAELAVLREKMNAVEVGDTGGVGAPQVGWKERLERLERLERPVSVQNGGVIEGDGDAGPSPGGGSEGGARLSDLDKRLASLEDLVGPSTEGLDSTSNSAPLLSTLSKLDHLLALLTQPRHLDAISRRVKLLLVDLDRAAAASRRPGGTSTVTTAPSDKATSNITLSSAEYASLQTLFSLLPRLDPLLPILPPLLARLRSLAGLHAEASDVADGLRRLQMEDKKNGEEIRELEEVVKTVQEGLGESAKGIMKNWEGIEGRMKRLEERVGKLGEGA